MKFVSLDPNDGKFPVSHKYAKYRVVIEDEGKHHTIYFGDNRYEDFTSHGDEMRKKRYLARHQMRENFEDPTTAGFWSARLLWNKKTVSDSLKDIFAKFPGLKSA